MKLYDAKVSFAGGELSPLLYGRVDLAQYQIGARTLQNFIVLPQGAVVNRPGTKSLGGNYGGKVRLVPFVFSEEDSCVLAFGSGYIDLYTSSGYGGRVTNSSPYNASRLPKLRWLQSGDVLYLFHPDVPVHYLSRTSGGWTLTQAEFRNGPFEDTNTDEGKKMWAYSSSGTGGADVEWNFDLRGVMAPGLLVRLETEVKANSAELTLRSGSGDFGAWVTMENVFGAYTIKTNGKWNGTIEVERLRSGEDPATGWESFKTWTSVSGAEENFSVSGDVEEYADQYRFRLKGGSSTVSVSFSFEGGAINRIFKMTSIVSNGAGGGWGWAERVDRQWGNVPETDAWALGAFNAAYGYPSLGIFHQERLVLANTKHSPQTLWMSQPASWHNFGASIPVKDDDAITVTLASKEINEIRGLASRGELLIFTAGGEWTARAGSKSDVFTPSSIVITPSGYRGSANIPPLDVGDVTLFLQRQGTSVRSIGYSLDVDGYASQDVSVLAEHLFRGNPVKAMSYQQTPWSVVWCVLSNGTVAALTLQKEHQVNAWTRQVFDGGSVEDVCVIPGAEQDEAFFVVRRGGAAFVEWLKHRDTADATFTDANGSAVNSVLECLEWEAGAGGTLQGRHKHIPAMTLRLMETRRLKGGIITENNSGLDDLPLDGSLYSGDVRMLPPGGTGRTCRVRLENSEAGPVTVLGIYPEVCVPEEMRNE